VKRRGFTLIELMVVIAIIIILAAIAIPNYLSMTLRAKKSRIASEFATVAIALESYNTDWGTYPQIGVTPQPLHGLIAVPALAIQRIFSELAGTGVTPAVLNVAGQSTSTGEGAPIVYISGGSLTQMVNPLVTLTTSANHWYYYATGTLAQTTDPALTWVLYAFDGTTYYYRTSDNGSLRQLAAPAVPAAP